MKYSSRFFLFAPIGAFAVLMAAVGIHWWFMANALGHRLEAMNGHEIAPGVVLHYGTRSIGGFPFTLDTVFSNVSFEVATPQGPIDWHSEKFAMHRMTYGRDEAIFEAAGKQSLDWVKSDGTRHHLDFAVGALHASAILSDKGLSRFDLDIVGFGSKAFVAQRLQFHIRRNVGDNFDLVIEGDGTQTGDKRDTVSFKLDGKMDHAARLDPVRAGQQIWFKGLDAWRVSGGVLHVTAATLSACGNKFAGRGDLNLDTDHRIAGRIDLRGRCAADMDGRPGRSGDFSQLGALY